MTGANHTSRKYYVKIKISYLQHFSSKLSASHGSMNVKLDFQLKSRLDGESRKVWSLLFMFSLNNKIKIPKNSSKEKLI